MGDTEEPTEPELPSVASLMDKQREKSGAKRNFNTLPPSASSKTASEDKPELSDIEDEVYKAGYKEGDVKRGGGTLPFRSWLWLHYHRRTEFFSFARYVLSGGPENIWVNKPLFPQQVMADLRNQFATNHVAVLTPQLFKLAEKAVAVYKAETLTVQDLIDERFADHEPAALTSAESDPYTYTARGTPWDYRYGEPRKDIRDEVQQGQDGALRTTAAGPEAPVRPMLDDRGNMRDGKTNVVKPHLTLEQPIAATLCSWTGMEHADPALRKKTDALCPNNSQPGSLFCRKHTALQSALTEEDIAAILRRGQERLLMLSGDAVEVIVDLMHNSLQDPVRLRAAETLLDRAGLKSVDKLEITSTTNINIDHSPAAVIQERLENLGTHFQRAVTNAAAAIQDAQDTVKEIEAEIVSEEAAHEHSGARKS